MRSAKGAIGIEFVISVALFLAAFWFIYLQSAFMLAPQLQRGDVRELGVEFYSTMMITDSVEGYAISSGVLNKTLLDNDNGLNCTDVQNEHVVGMEFAWKVSSAAGSWECVTDIPKEGVVKRAAYVHFAGMAYHPAIVEVWAV